MSSWPGRYESAWDALVKASRGGHLSAAVVFLPEKHCTAFQWYFEGGNPKKGACGLKLFLERSNFIKRIREMTVSWILA